ncbi:MAG: hypothetical protein CVV64_10985 [Candidatus Wallbacteria bacterium HGW-Wallbacteria-1]|jgi:glycosyltransferase involved in cell wall biosynthesis|uniref:Glycosyltransferase family 1 protein n=1 Tax=Candidatus Wallbacteria bacterium HGW-Wallbacteria-1 TaxID=2013854 RepID=A0A2N1PPH4_9BACT|nr:MAG: hypothetical protein CVV64_10985 [Candidatus Wallbacteria bacterium HGW-Wallbacteria-1]
MNPDNSQSASSRASHNHHEPLRVLVINPASGSLFGGAEAGLVNLAAHTDPSRISLTFACPRGELADRLTSMGASWIPLELPHELESLSRQGGFPWIASLKASLKLASLALRVRSIVRRGKFDIVHTNGIKSHFYGGAGALLARCLWTIHFRDIPAPGWPVRLARFIAMWSSAVICNSRATAAIFDKLSRLGSVFTGPDILVVPNGTPAAENLPTQEEKAGNRKLLGLPSQGPMILSVGHLAPLKGYTHLIDAMAVLSESIDEIAPESSLINESGKPFLVIVGGEPYITSFQGHGSMLQMLEQKCRELKNVTVIFAGQISDPLPYYRAADLFCLPSLSEGFGRANLEAMAQGLPVVSTSVGGIPEVVQHNVTGLLCSPGNSEKLAAALAQLLVNTDEAKKMGLQGHLRVKMDFSSRTTAEKITKIWQELSVREN